MSAVTEIRKKYNLSQYTLADYLGVSRSTLAMIENGKRDLPIEALKKINILASTYEKNTSKRSAAADVALPAKELAAFRREVKQQLDITNRKAALMEEKVLEMENAFQVQLLQCAAINKILANVEKSKNHKQGNHMLLHQQLQETNNRFKKFHPVQQALLKIKLQSLKLEVSLLQQLLKTSPDKIR